MGHFISCRTLRELSQFRGATSFGFSGFVFSVLRQTLPFFLIHAFSPGLHSELLAFQGGSSSLHQREKLELEYEFHLGSGLIVSELSAHLPAGGESRSVSSRRLAVTWGRVGGSEAPAKGLALCGCPNALWEGTFANVCSGVGKWYLKTSTAQGHQAAGQPRDLIISEPRFNVKI